MIPRRVASSAGRRLPSSVQDLARLGPSSSCASSNRQVLGLRHASDLSAARETVLPSSVDLSSVGSTTIPSASHPYGSTTSPSNAHSTYLPALSIAPFPHLAPKRVSFDKGFLPPPKAVVNATSRRNIGEWNDRLQGLVRNGDRTSVNLMLKEMRRLHVRTDERTVDILAGYMDLKAADSADAATESGVETDRQALLALGSELYSLPAPVKTLSFEVGAKRVLDSQKKVKDAQKEHSEIQRGYVEISKILADQVKTSTPRHPHYLARPFPELDAFRAELKAHYNHWAAEVPKYLQAYWDAKKGLSISATAEEKQEAELKKQHHQDAISFRDTFKPQDPTLYRPREDDWATPSFTDFINAYNERVSSMPKSNLSEWRVRLRKHKAALADLAQREWDLPRLILQAAEAEEKLETVRANTDLSKVDYADLPAVGKKAYELMREVQDSRDLVFQHKQVAFGKKAALYADQARHASAIVAQTVQLEHDILFSFPSSSWNIVARRFAALRTSEDTTGNLSEDWITAFVSTYQLYSAWHALHENAQSGAEISLVTLQSLSQLVHTTPTYPPALRIVTEITDRLLTAEGGAGVRAVRKNVKHLKADTAYDFLPLPSLNVRHAPVHQLLETITDVLKRTSVPSGGLSPDVRAHMEAVVDTINDQLKGNARGLFDLEDFAENSQPRRVEGAKMRKTVEKLASAFELKLAGAGRS